LAQADQVPERFLPSGLTRQNLATASDRAGLSLAAQQAQVSLVLTGAAQLDFRPSALQANYIATELRNSGALFSGTNQNRPAVNISLGNERSALTLFYFARSEGVAPENLGLTHQPS